MLVQVRLESKGFVAPCAHEWLGVGVRLNVRSKVALVRKGLFADVA